MRNLRSGGAIFMTVLGCVAATGSRDEPLGIGARCHNTEECHSVVPNSQCVYDGCFCLRSHYYDGQERRCKPVSPLGDPCSHDNHCGSSLMCQRGACACMPGYRRGHNACEPVGSLGDFESYGELPSEKPNVFVVVLEGLGLLALKVSLIYLFAKIVCASCKHLAHDATLREVRIEEIYGNGAATSGLGDAPSADEAFAPTVASAVPMRTSFYPRRPLDAVYVQASTADSAPIDCKTDYDIAPR